MSEGKSLLELLAAACQKHQVCHHNKTESSNCDDDIPHSCRKDLTLLLELLPRVEATCCKDDSIEVLGHLCDFYNDVISGGFCPHAPNLFRWGKSGASKFFVANSFTAFSPSDNGLIQCVNIKAFQRVFQLMEVTISNLVLEMRPLELTKKISYTIACLLTYERGHQENIVRDLVNFLFDLSVIHEAKLFDFNDSVRISLFTESFSNGSGLSLVIPSISALFALQASTLEIICEFASKNVLHRLESEESRHFLDALFDNNYSLPKILSAIRQTLMASITQHSMQTQYYSLQAKLNSLEFLKALSTEYQHFGADKNIQTMVLTLSKTILWVFENYNQIGDARNMFYINLRTLFLEIIIFMPELRFGCFQKKAQPRSLILFDLLDCLKPMSKMLRKTCTPTSEIDLCNVVLESVDLFFSENSILKVSMNHFESHGLFPSIFELLVSPLPEVRIIMIRIVRRIINTKGSLEFVASACRFALIGSRQESSIDTSGYMHDQLNPTEAKVIQLKRNEMSRSLEFQPLPKRLKHCYTQEKDILVENDDESYNFLFFDSLRIFLLTLLRHENHIQDFYEAENSDPFMIGNNGELLIEALRQYETIILLLLPIVCENNRFDNINSILEILGIMLDSLLKATSKIHIFFSSIDLTQNIQFERIITFMESLADVGLACHFAQLKATDDNPMRKLSKQFLLELSQLAWKMMGVICVSTPPASVFGSWLHHNCHKCQPLSRLLDLESTECEKCLCRLHVLEPNQHGLDYNDDLYALRLPFPLKIVVFSFTHPPIIAKLIGKEFGKHDLFEAQKKLWDSVETFIEGCLQSNNERSHFFSKCLLCLLPLMIISLTRETWKIFKECYDLQGKEMTLSLDEVYRTSCNLFLQQKLINVINDRDANSLHRAGALIAIQHYRYLLKTTKWKDNHSNELSKDFQLYYASKKDFFQDDINLNLESIHGIASIDLKIRLSILSANNYFDGLSSLDRIKKWMVLKEIFIQSSQSDLERLGIDLSEKIMMMISLPFIDPDYQVRFSISPELGIFLLHRDGHMLTASVKKTEQSRIVDHREWAIKADLSIMQWFDNHLFKHADFSPPHIQSILSNTFQSADTKQVTDQFKLQRKQTSLRSIASICQYLTDNDLLGCIFHHALIQLVRIWIASDVNETYLASASAIAFFELRRLGCRNKFSYVSLNDYLKAYIPVLYSEILHPASCALFSESSILDLGQQILVRQNNLLYTFLKLFVLKRNSFYLQKNSHLQYLRVLFSAFDVTNFVDESLPYVMYSMIFEKDYDAVQLLAGFKLYVLGINAKIAKVHNDVITGVPIQAYLANAKYSSKFKTDLKQQAKRLCLQPKLIQYILPRLLMNSRDPSPLVFFLNTVLQKVTTFKTMITNSDKAILKEIIWELGSLSNADQVSIQGLKVAALARENATKGIDDKLGEDHNSQKQHAHNIASKWVSTHFMFLMVNIIELKWNEKTLHDQQKALRCLNLMLRFLLPSEAPMFISHIITTVNTAMSQESNSFIPESDVVYVQELRHLAAHSLALYVKIMIPENIQIIGDHLISLVVALFPVLSYSDIRTIDGKNDTNKINDATKTAVEILELLTSGVVGKALSRNFQGIPFLPLNPLLDGVMQNLKSNGVEIDHLLVISGTQNIHNLSGKDDVQPTLCYSDRKPCLNEIDDSLIAYLQARLRIIRPLLSHESSSVRIAILQHLIDLHRANRYLFYRLIEAEDPSSIPSELTIQYVGAEKTSTRGSMTLLLETLLSRATTENSRMIQVLLGTCLGEIGSIDPNRLGLILSVPQQGSQQETLKNYTSGRSWLLAHPPWRSSAKEYAFHIISRHLVKALKASSNAAEQHKVAHTIQQLLVILDNPTNQLEEKGEEHFRETAQVQKNKKPMSDWLVESLDNEGVLNLLEPYWATSFSENLSSRNLRLPPFFRKAENYFQWISRFCRFLIIRSHETNSQCRWRRMLYSCRTVVRSMAGSLVSEFIMPLLVLERLCYGSVDDEHLIQKEFLDVFELSIAHCFDDSSRMGYSERQRAVNTAFLLIDVFKRWVDKETESSPIVETKLENEGLRAAAISSKEWNSVVAIEKVNDFLNFFPIDIMAKAAFTLGMHARALQCLETKARMTLVEPVFGLTTTNESGDDDLIKINVQHGFGSYLLLEIDLSLMKDVLGKLGDYSTSNAIPSNGFNFTYDSSVVHEKESKGDWVGALNDYERAFRSQNSEKSDLILEKGTLCCLLSMGQYESVLKQVDGIIFRAQTRKAKLNDVYSTVIPIAVNAAWRLGNWSKLENLVEENGSNTCLNNNFHFAIGKAMLDLYRGSESSVTESLLSAKESLMLKLSSIARDGYERAYSTLVKLQCIREIEDVTIFLSQCPVENGSCDKLFDIAMSIENFGWAWGVRLDVTSTINSSLVSDVRLALARITNDKKLEREIFYIMGRKARKFGFHDIASTCFAEAYSLSTRCLSRNWDSSIKWESEIQMQLAKLEYECGQTTLAIRLLGVDDLKGWINLKEIDLHQACVARLQVMSGYTQISSDINAPYIIAKRILKSTTWMANSGLKSVPEIKERFRIIKKLRPKWEKCHFEFGKYLDTLMEARLRVVAHVEGCNVEDDNVRHNAISEDINCQNYLAYAMEQYLEALKLSDDHVYQALPRVLSLWLEFTSIERHDWKKGKAKQYDSNSSVQMSSDPMKFLRNKQDEVNRLFQEAASRIPSSMFYIATPQLISRLIHPNAQTSLTVQTLLTRVLAKFPGQAMWALAWVRNSLDKARANLGNEIFHSAQKSIITWAANEKKVDASRKLLFERNRKIIIASKSFITYLIDIAKYLPKDERSRSFKVGKWRGEVELCDFLPPVQTALSTPLDITKGNDIFPRFRAIHTGIQIMSSKAKPKRVKFYIVPNASGNLINPGAASEACAQDLGEMHFLVKNEAKGDLRKDARVQDLNNVINRLMTCAGKGKKQRRLWLRTFAVTCLSEDCGIVEWVPNTESFRSLASKSYNPQVPVYSEKRRGKRIANFGDQMLKKNYEDCQNCFFKNGDLNMAVKLFEKHFLQAYPPLFYWWFIHNFTDPHLWYEARTNFTSSAAAWSAVGHVIGLGDRHSENLLIDTSNGGCVHVDFDW
jgi:serine/threonine-protein kinase ATR